MKKAAAPKKRTAKVSTKPSVVEKPKAAKSKKSRPKPVRARYPMDAARKPLITEIKSVYKKEGYAWLLKVNPLELYTTEQLQSHVERLRAGHRAWVYKPNK